MPFLHCRIEGELYIPVSVQDVKKDPVPIENAEPVFRVRADGTKEDLRTQPPFLALSPCPYCNQENDKHDALKHINPQFGTPVPQGDT